MAQGGPEQLDRAEQFPYLRCDPDVTAEGLAALGAEGYPA
jgi:hypothetical protein